MGGRLDYMTLPIPAAISGVDRFTAAFAMLRDLHARRTQVSPATLLYDIYDRTHLLPLFALRPQGAQRVANLLKLIDTAQALAAQGLNTLTAFNRFLARQEHVAEEGEPPITEDHDDVLRLFTIHKAKGLEFPVVVLADAVYNNNGRSSRTGIIERISGSLELQVGPRALTCTTQGWQKAEAREQARDAAEERRLWYVAAARVRDHLIIPVLPRVKAGASVGQWTSVDDSAPSSSNVFPPEGAENGQVFVYHSSPVPVGQTVPVRPAVTELTRIEPDAMTLRIYQEWEAERREVLARGRQAGMPGAVPDRNRK